MVIVLMRRVCEYIYEITINRILHEWIDGLVCNMFIPLCDLHDKCLELPDVCDLNKCEDWFLLCMSNL